jgi:hypothetical protein
VYGMIKLIIVPLPRPTQRRQTAQGSGGPDL